MSEELKPCPFCGGKPILEDHRTIWAVRCDCGICMLGERAPEPEEEMPDEYWERFKQSAIDAWNRRAPIATEGQEPVGEITGMWNTPVVKWGDSSRFLNIGDHIYTHPQPQVQGEPVADTGNVEADRLISRLMSSDPDFDDCIDAAVFIRKLVAEHRGPDGFDTWKGAALDERMRRIKAEQPRAAVPDDATVDKYIDAILRASGSSLRNYSMKKTIDSMRKAMREAMAAAPAQPGEARGGEG